MSSNKGSDFNSAQWHEAAEGVYSYFESQWRQGNRLRFEQVLHKVPELVESFGVDACNSEFLKEVAAELIRMEMDLKHRDGIEIDPNQYRQRIFGFNSVIGEAFERIKNLEQDDPTLPPPRRTEPSMPFQIAGSTQDMVPGEKAESGDKQQIPERLGNFRDVCYRAEGSFGIVCSAVDKRSNQIVALKFPLKKVLSDNQRYRMFLEEAEHSMKLDHPGIVKTYGSEQIEGYLVIVQQFVDGEDLHKARARYEPSSDANQQTGRRRFYDVCELIAKIADALAHAHLKGVYHRDLKPANVLMDRDGNPLIVDFGLALDEEAQLRTKDSIAGSPPYMSPEAVEGRNWAMDGRTDIWSLGVILYRFLTGQLPFKGLVTADFFRAIKSRDPRPFRQIDLEPKIPVELERICFRCLEKPIKDRYSSADELADDLRHWVAQDKTTKRKSNEEPREPEQKIESKGLLAYGPEDSNFFLRMLPGPRDRNDIPSSIRFWKVRIEEPVDPVNRVPIGVIYGPSGSGKSSFVKAGLLPQLTTDVTHVYVESAQQHTEVRLLLALRRQFPEIPGDTDLTLPEVLRGLRLGQWRKNCSKILIVMDQFEQRLSQGDVYQESQLANALRQCDGGQLQCLLLIRDDFWMGMTRFADALEMELREGENSHPIDLFDREHAKMILAEIGKSTGRLDPAFVISDKTSSGPGEFLEQNQFLDEAIDQLAQDNYVICVRMTLFAEMFKSRPWTPAELDSVGGIQGVGEKFLDEVFGSRGSSRRLKLQKEPVQSVLAALLPEPDSDIRGAMKKRSELFAVSSYESQPKDFEKLLRTLDQELRLITPTDPDTADRNLAEASSADSPAKYFQLTHDYLVPSIRDWLTSELRTTRRGKAQIRLRELASEIKPGIAPKNRPTNLEWLLWSFYFRKSQLSTRELSVMRYGRNRFLATSGLAAAAIFMAVLLGSLAFSYYRFESDGNDLFADVMGQKFDQLPELIEQLPKYKKIVTPKFGEVLESYEADSEEYRRALLGSLCFDSELDNRIVKSVLRTDCQPSELQTSVQVLKLNGSEVERSLRGTLDSGDAPLRRFRAAVALVILNSKEVDWPAYSGMIGSALAQEPATTHDQWITLLEPIGDQLSPSFLKLFSKTSDQKTATALAAAIHSFVDPSKRSALFADRILEANKEQFEALLSVVEKNKEQTEVLNILLQKTEILDEAKLASRAVALLRLGHPDEFANQLKDSTSQSLRSLTLFGENSKQFEFESLKQLYESTWAKRDAAIRQGLLMAMADRLDAVMDNSRLTWLDETVEKICLEDKDAGCFATAELIARRRAIDYIKFRQRRRKDSQSGIKGNVFINKQDQAFSVIHPNQANKLTNPIAVSLTEISQSEWFAFLEEMGLPTTTDRPNGDLPYVVRGVFDNLLVYQYCNRQSFKDGCLEDEWIYPTKLSRRPVELHFDLTKSGYRLMTVAEWQAVCGWDESPQGFLGTKNQLANNFAWTNGNAESELQPVGTLMPNRLGMFDIFGNANDLCTIGNVSKYQGMGQTVREGLKGLSAITGRPSAAPNLPALLMGFRLVRTMPVNTD